MNAYEKILLNGGNPAQLLGLALAECDAHFTYDELSGKVSGYEKSVCLMRENMEVILEHNRKELEELIKKTPEDYRNELLKEARQQLSDDAVRLIISQRIYDSAKEKADELEPLGSSNEIVQAALNKLRKKLKTILWNSKSDVDYLKKRTAELEEKISDLIEWSDKTREAVSRELEQKIRKVSTAVNMSELRIRSSEATFQRNMETMKAYEEIADLFGTETEETVEKE